MLRNEWEFGYTAKQLADAATAQLAFREGRIEVWSAKKVEVIAEIRASGLNIEESIADMLTNASYAKYSVNTRSEREPAVTIDMKLRRDLQECAEKIRDHTDLRNQYKAWMQVLQAQGEQTLKLQHDDWIFFFGK